MHIDEKMLGELQAHEWFHAIDLGEGISTCGRFPPGAPQNQTLFSVFDLLKDINVSGMDVLDIGATDGLVSFGLEKLGARSVVATDRVDGVGMRSIQRLIGSKVERLIPVEISNINEKLKGRCFDMIICAGVIYHMLNPLSAFMACRGLLRPRGLLIVETAMSWLVKQPVLILNSEVQENMESSTYWTPTPAALKGMTKLCHFEVLAARLQPVTGRGAVLGRAIPASTPVKDSTVLLAAMHKHGLLDYGFQELLAAADAQPASSITYKGPGGEKNIDPASYTPNFPFHAHRPDPRTAIGRRDWHVVGC